MTPGGVQTVRWDERVFLRGPARLVCRGDFFLLEDGCSAPASI
jgi:hypothetical protein